MVRFSKLSLIRSKRVSLAVGLFKALMRVHLRSRQEVSDRSHLLLLVTIEGSSQYIVDVALGSLSMSVPVKLDVDCGEQLTKDGPRCVSWFGDDASRATYLLSARHSLKSESSRDIYEFRLTDGEFAMDDMIRENRFASSHESDLATRLIVTRVCDASRSRVTLRNEELTVKNSDGVLLSSERVDDHDTLLRVLRERFAIDLGAAATKLGMPWMFRLKTPSLKLSSSVS